MKLNFQIKLSFFFSFELRFAPPAVLPFHSNAYLLVSNIIKVVYYLTYLSFLSLHRGQITQSFEFRTRKGTIFEIDKERRNLERENMEQRESAESNDIESNEGLMMERNGSSSFGSEKELGMREPLLLRKRTWNGTSQTAIVGANVCPIESLDYEYVFAFFFFSIFFCKNSFKI